MAAPIRELFPDGAPPAEEAANTAEILPSPSDPLAVARILLRELTEEQHLLLRRWRGEWWKYEGPHWVAQEVEALRRYIYLRLEFAAYYAKTKDGDVEAKPWAPDKGKVDKVLDAMSAPTLIERDVDSPSWLSTATSASYVVPCLNGLVDVRDQQLHPMTPDYFGSVCIPVSYDPAVGEPTEWLKFLRTLWPPVQGPDGLLYEADEVLTLQEWFGYALSGRMDLQKMLLVVGPPRSGKSTIGRILTELLGKANVAAPTLAGMATNFGLQPLIGKTLGIIGDARLQSHGQETVVERILSITGQDAQNIDRKNLPAYIGTLPTRLMLISNELPKFGDASGAVASRFVILTLTESFLGREDIELEDRIRGELAAILKWSLDGVVRLQAQKRITEPRASVEAVQELADLVSPISAFLREVCLDDEPNALVPFSELYREYGLWCDENHRGQKNTAGFSTDIRSRMPTVKTDVRPKVDGRKQPRHVKGLRINPEWTTRVRDTPTVDGFMSGGDQWRSGRS
ncbi:DNA primase family protein [Pseudonocardia broussonetiae]|uniref:NTP-binding protein n=1 Tax=Pseudonocardia broussonetiae TaxID=2736640 RepID=A0A6M6JTN1_9PSEU|nr:DNA primase family protein [Pseudonocardia broussonetiae]QJY51228.1 NTP-binding protein [Pseudonocardia broussonetiae]